MKRSIIRNKKWPILMGVVAACLLGSLSPAIADEFEDKIAAFAAKQVGQKVGDGHSTRLVEQAFAAAGAKPGQGFVWGRALNAGESMQPGDIIQFKSVVIMDGGATWNLGFPDHTAIVSNVSGSKVTLIHQNMDGQPAVLKSHVRSQVIDLGKKTSGSFIVYRPVAR